MRLTSWLRALFPRLLSRQCGIDLHLHTTESDGALSARALVDLAVSRGVRTLSITDHDTTRAIEPVAAYARSVGARLVPGASLGSFPASAGVEISADLSGSSIHILGYFGSLSSLSEVELFLKDLQTERYARMRRMVSLLAEQGIHVDFERVLALSGGKEPGRPHLARVLLEMGVISEFQEAFTRFIGDSGPWYRVSAPPALSYAPGLPVSIERVVSVIHGAGGLAVLAHPSCYRDISTVLDLCLASGVDGVEVHGSHASFRGFAEEHGLFRSFGSDFHGLTESDVMPGEFDVSEEDVRLLEERILPLALV